MSNPHELAVLVAKSLKIKGATITLPDDPDAEVVDVVLDDGEVFSLTINLSPAHFGPLPG